MGFSLAQSIIVSTDLWTVSAVSVCIWKDLSSGMFDIMLYKIAEIDIHVSRVVSFVQILK